MNYAHVARLLDRVDTFVEKWRLSKEARKELISLLDAARDEAVKTDRKERAGRGTGEED